MEIDTQPPTLLPIASKIGRESPGAIFEFDGKRFIGSINLGFSNFLSLGLGIGNGVNHAGFYNLIAFDLYRYFSEGAFLVPNSFVEECDVINSFTENHTFAKQLHQQASKCIWFFSEIVDGYRDFNEAKVLLNNSPCSFLEFVQQTHRPPEKLLTNEGYEVNLYGIMELLAVGRALGHTDTLGSGITNSGWIWEYENGKIISARTVLVDPKKSFTITQTDPNDMNLVRRTMQRTGRECRWLSDLKNIQSGHTNQDMVLHWNALTIPQKQIFYNTLRRCTKVPHEELRKRIENNEALASMKFKLSSEAFTKLFNEEINWLALQEDIYAGCGPPVMIKSANSK